MDKRIKFNASPKAEAKVAAQKKIVAKAKEAKSTKKIFTIEEAYKRMTPQQRVIMAHKATDIVMVTGKDFGKGYMVGMKTIAYMEEDYRASAFALKKYKTNALERLSVTFQNLATEIKMWGYTIPTYEKGQSKIYRMKNKIKLNNQSIEAAGFDDYNSITGAEAYNLGTFPIVFFDEPSQMGDDPSKIPTIEEWNMRISAMKSSITRSNTRHMATFKRVVQPTQYYFALNPWDSHPLVVETEKILPEREFMDFITKDLLNNHTMMRYDEENDKLYVRGTMFGNPIINIFEKLCVKYDIKSLVDFQEVKDTIDYSGEEFEKFFINNATLFAHLKKYNGIPIYIQAQKAINMKNSAKLAEILGMKFIGKSKYKPVYDLSNIKLMDTDEVLENMDETTNQIIGWDIDQRKGGRFVATPVWLAYKHVGTKTYKNIIVGKQREIKSYGVGSTGAQIPVYVDKMTNASKEMYRKFRSKTFNDTIITMDDNSRHYINAVSNKLPEIRFTSTKFKTKKSWLILKRQSWLQSAMDFGYLIVDKDNIGLIKDLQISVSKEGSKQRDESGGKAEHYDRINSLEYALYYLRGEVSANFPPGEVEIYKSTNVETKEITHE